MPAPEQGEGGDFSGAPGDYPEDWIEQGPSGRASGPIGAQRFLFGMKSCRPER